MLDMVGKKFGKLIILKFSRHGKNYNHKWLCKCDCGTEKEISICNLRGNTKSCGCARRWTGYGEISGCKWNLIQISARRRKIEFKISIEYAWKIFLKQNKKCAISGKNILFIRNMGGPNRNKQTASLDRIDSSKGYIKGNVQWVHKDVNLMKGGFENEYFIKMCEEIYKFQKKT